MDTVKLRSYCPTCIGTGWLQNKLCGVCEGSGEVMRTTKIETLVRRTEERVKAKKEISKRVNLSTVQK
jgi:DnaJ-class molecular chaperone